MSGNDDSATGLLARYSGQRAILETEATVETIEDLGSFGRLRGVRDRAVMLELRKRTGTVLAVGTAWLESIEYDPSTGLHLAVASRRIVITGRNLDAGTGERPSLLAGLVRQRIAWIRETDRADALSTVPDAVVIERIEW